MRLPGVVSISVLACIGCVDPARPAATPAEPAGPHTDALSIEAPTTDAEAAPTAAVAHDAPVPPEAPEAEQIPEEMLPVRGGGTMVGLDDKGELDERPAHEVMVAAFLLDRTEVTHEAYGHCVTAGVCRPPAPRSAERNGFGNDTAFRTPKRPVSGVSHDDAQAYCQWLNKRLPTEAEWERAARGSDARMYPWGNETPTAERGVFRAGVTQDVGSRPAGAGPYGHLDLAGNVWEWVADHYDPYAYRRETAAQGIPGSCEDIMQTLAELKRKKMHGFTGTNPIPDECEHVLRGGAFNYPGWGLRSSNRVHHPGRFRLVMSGFRCARDWPGGKSD